MSRQSGYTVVLPYRSRRLDRSRQCRLSCTFLAFLGDQVGCLGRSHAAMLMIGGDSTTATVAMHSQVFVVWPDFQQVQVPYLRRWRSLGSFDVAKRPVGHLRD